jgi:hypothetical protein
LLPLLFLCSTRKEEGQGEKERMNFRVYREAKKGEN